MHIHDRSPRAKQASGTMSPNYRFPTSYLPDAAAGVAMGEFNIQLQSQKISTTGSGSPKSIRVAASPENLDSTGQAASGTIRGSSLQKKIMKTEEKRTDRA